MSGKIKIVVDPELQDLIPVFLSNRQKDIQAILAAVETGNLKAAQTLGHGMKGAGGGYGFGEITQIGAAIERAAAAADPEAVRREVEKLSQYLEQIEIIFGEAQ